MTSTEVATVEEFADAITQGEEKVKLMSNLSPDRSYSLTNDLTLNLNGCVIQASLQEPLFRVGQDKTLILTGDGVIENAKWIASVSDGGMIVIENGTYVTNKEGFTLTGDYIKTQETAIVPHIGSIVEMNGGLIETVDNFGIASNGTKGQGRNTVIINGGKIDAHITSPGYEACAVYVANNDVFIMNDGELVSNNGCGICMRAGDVTINGGSIIANGEAGTTGKVGDGNFQMSKSAVIFHETSNYPGQADGEMKLTIEGGIFEGVDHSVEVLSEAAEPKVYVNGGAFTPPYPENQ